ncbi:MAG: heavy metal translocating P-type ATPase [Eubacterium sp.]|nr:heavy metal translocating P-type ATPase [Eubacterium sp.]
MKQYDVKGMSCAACQARVEKAVSRVPGVTACSVSLLTNSMGVEGEASPEDVIRAVKNAGYGASEKTGSETTQNTRKTTDSVVSFQEESIQNLKHRLILSVVFLLLLMYITMGHNMFGFPLPSFLTGNILALTLTQMLLALVVMMINREFFVSGFRAVRHLSPNMDTLVAFGSSVSFGWSLFVFYRMTDMIIVGSAYAGADSLENLYHNQLYFESAAMIPALITVGKLLEAIAKGRTTNALESLMRLAPKTAILLRDGEEVRVNIDEVKVGDCFVVKPGQILPADGVVVDGEGAINESALTGESQPVEKKKETRVSAATVMMSGRLVCRVTGVGEDTTLSQIIQMVSEAAATKAPIARIADKVSAVFVPSVIGIALLVIAGWLIAGESVGFALARGICVLVISCPCALGLATPVAIMVGNGIGAKNGILFKTGESLELTGRVGIVVTDKTGTITYGDPEMTGIIREDSKSAIQDLRKFGMRVIMLSGDKLNRAERIAKEVGVDEVIAEVLPDGKEGHVREIMKQGKTAMVGDGINDAPALTVADVGIAIGDGTDVAVDSADVVLMNSSLRDVVKAIKLSRRTLRTIRQNLFWAFFYNIVCIPMAAGLYGWQMSPMLGAAAMALSSVTVCLNALRLNLSAGKL